MALNIFEWRLMSLEASCGVFFLASTLWCLLGSEFRGVGVQGFRSLGFRGLRFRASLGFRV